MPKIISFEGCIGAGKTTLTNYFAHTLHMEKILEAFQKNPFLEEFYHGQDVTLETEMAFLLIHCWQLKKALKTSQSDYVLADFSIEKDLVYARLNLEDGALRVFEDAYDYVVKQVGVPYVTIYLDLSLDNLRRRIFQRGRPYEMEADVNYFKEYNDRVKEYFLGHSCSTVYCFDVNDLQLDPDNAKLIRIRDRILGCCSGTIRG
ncbi:MAG: hypothetical protein D9V47_01355 [Clostridia bacterium]|nr:MAG: hypothetical protein D9V47_01355 [Clostridia bacterium]